MLKMSDEKTKAAEIQKFNMKLCALNTAHKPIYIYAGV